MSNKIKYGLKKVHYAVITDTDGVITYETPVNIPGAVNLALTPRGDTTEFYADDMAYFVTTANNGYEGTLEVALVPDQFKIDVLGYKQDQNNVLFEDANAIPKNIALMFEFSGDKNQTRHILYNVSVARTNVESATKGASVEVQTETMNIVASPTNDGYVKAKSLQGSTGYDTFFTTVYEYIEPTGV